MIAQRHNMYGVRTTHAYSINFILFLCTDDLAQLWFRALPNRTIWQYFDNAVFMLLHRTAKTANASSHWTWTLIGDLWALNIILRVICIVGWQRPQQKQKQTGEKICQTFQSRQQLPSACSAIKKSHSSCFCSRTFGIHKFCTVFDEVRESVVRRALSMHSIDGRKQKIATKLSENMFGPDPKNNYY